MAKKLAMGAGKTGKDADEFVKDNQGFTLTHEQQVKLSAF